MSAARYSRHTALPQIGEAGQATLATSRVLIIGLGGLGSPAALYLASAGVGHLVLSDFDRVEDSNLQRQIIHTLDDIGAAKVASAQRHLKAINPDIQITGLDYALSETELAQQVQWADVVLDCSDNFASRFALNRACVVHKTPLVSGAAIRFEGQLSVFDARQANSPCYQCLYPDDGSEGESCQVMGILAPVVGVIGSLQAVEALKVLLNIGEVAIGRLLLFDGLQQTWRSLKIKRDATL